MLSLTMRGAPRLALGTASLAHLSRSYHPAIMTIGSRTRPTSLTSPPISHFSSITEHRASDSAAKAKALNQQGLEDQEEAVKSQIDDNVEQLKENQVRTPWHREGSDKPPVRRLRSASAMTKG